MSKLVAVAFSGGLDTSWCVPHLMDQGWEVVTVTVDVGGFSATELADLAKRSKELGARDHILVPAKQIFFDEVLRYLIAGNVLRGGLYPLCVGAERTLQAREVITQAHKIGADAIAHGCTAAGNDQIRFEVAVRSLAPNMTMLAPVRDLTPTRAEQVALLESRGLPIPSKGSHYSVNTGLWGVTIGGVETTGTVSSIPESEWIRTKGAFDRLHAAKSLKIGFENGVPVSLDGQAMNSVDLIESLDKIAGEYGIGRGIHLGETILGIKGRVAFEAPAANVLLTAHRELEKLVLTKRQQQAKDLVASLYGDMVHEGLYPEPACRDIEALLRNSQTSVTGEVFAELKTGNLFITGVSSPYSLHAASRSTYGEAASEWTPEDAKGFGRLYGLASELHARVAAK